MILGKKIGAAVLSFALVLSLLVLPAGAAGEIGVTIDGTSVLYDDGYGRPFLDSAGRTQVPFRLTMESFGCAVYWNNETRTARGGEGRHPGWRFPSARPTCWSTESAWKWTPPRRL